MVVIGVLALQGAFLEHVTAFADVGCRAVEVRTPSELAACDGLVIPGGESTAISLIAQRLGMWEPLCAWIRAGKPTWGTCAGMILLADRLVAACDGQQSLGGLDITVQRNYFGSQIASSTLAIDVDPSLRTGAGLIEAPDEGEPFGVFIRAPAVISTGPAARPVAWVSYSARSVSESDAPRRVIVAAIQGRLLATAFHPELTPQRFWHRLFVRMVSAAVGEATCTSRTSAQAPVVGPGVAAAPSVQAPIVDFPAASRTGALEGHPILSTIPLPVLPVSALTPGTGVSSSFRSR
jgi:pyridoxal 5'-phosphate synthase pdxT subunit